MMASGNCLARQAGHKGATDRIFHLRRSAVHDGMRGCIDIAKLRPSLPRRQPAVSTPTWWRISIHCTRDASWDIKLGCQDHHPAAIAPRPPPSDPRPTGRGARLLSQSRRRSRRWLFDTAGLPIGEVDRDSGLTRCRRWRTCWTGFRSGGATCPRASRTVRQRKRLMPCWRCAVMSKSSRRSSCQRASDGTDNADR
jgi:hypothetical protein